MSASDARRERQRRTQYPRMIPFFQPYLEYISPTMSLRRLGFVPYCACSRTLNISTGLARTAWTAPAIEPAAAICEIDS